ncbi:MAG: Gfo/Idh/MocA family oxidoreductase [Steroidobacteraceae bacterium]|jgi:predicted dehydrogenase|nr:Gfo/Idh/MocA family oxidoreductase [Steroidobacteraceae bacterium]
MTSPPLRTAVIGAGYLGRFHAQKYATLPGSRLVAIVDPDAATRERVGQELGVPALADHRALLGEVDAVSIVTPTPLHHPLTRDFLAAGAHVLVEKPITSTLEEARDLVALASARGRVLQVGHLERFNPAIVAIEGLLEKPRFIESNRLAPFKPRGTDVSVVLDLMIHDIDLVQNIVRAPVASIDAVGAPVFTDEIDIANARLRFADGCVADVTASRISMKTERKLRIFQADTYLSVDLQQKVLTQVRKGAAAPAGEMPQVAIDERSFDQGDALRDEIASFLEAIVTGRRPVVSGEDGLRALETAIRIGELLGRPAPATG